MSWVRRIKKPDLVYFALDEEGGRIKIGCSSDYVRRIQRVAREAGCRLEPVGILSGSRLTEARIHERFSHLRLHGEWFRFSQEIYDFIDRVEGGLEHPKYGRHV